MRRPDAARGHRRRPPRPARRERVVARTARSGRAGATRGRPTRSPTSSACARRWAGRSTTLSSRPRRAASATSCSPAARTSRTGRVRVIIPIALHARDAKGTAVASGLYENRITGVFADLPVGEPDPAERARIIREQLVRAQGVARGRRRATRSPGCPASRPRRSSPSASAPRPRRSQGMINSVVSNVPGPQVPLYALGRKVLAAYPSPPIFPVGARMGVAVFSYDGGLHFGLIADYSTVPDLHVLRDGIRAGLDELLEAIGRRFDLAAPSTCARSVPLGGYADLARSHDEAAGRRAERASASSATCVCRCGRRRAAGGPLRALGRRPDADGPRAHAVRAARRVRAALRARVCAARAPGARAERSRHVRLGREFAPFDERDDGLATLAWIEAQPWHDGPLGMAGASYLGLVQWAVAGAAGERLGGDRADRHGLAVPWRDLRRRARARVDGVVAHDGRRAGAAAGRPAMLGRLARLRGAYDHLPLGELDVKVLGPSERALPPRARTDRRRRCLLGEA